MTNKKKRKIQELRYDRFIRELEFDKDGSCQSKNLNQPSIIYGSDVLGSVDTTFDDQGCVYEMEDNLSNYTGEVETEHSPSQDNVSGQGQESKQQEDDNESSITEHLTTMSIHCEEEAEPVFQSERDHDNQGWSQRWFEDPSINESIAPDHPVSLYSLLTLILYAGN